jgi:hypothetical protein
MAGRPENAPCDAALMKVDRYICRIRLTKSSNVNKTVPEKNCAEVPSAAWSPHANVLQPERKPKPKSDDS